MDYIYFAINAIAIGLTTLMLLSYQKQKKRQPVQVSLYLISTALAAAYFALNQFVFSQNLWSYLTANLLPIILLTAVSVFFLQSSPVSRR